MNDVFLKSLEFVVVGLDVSPVVHVLVVVAPQVLAVHPFALAVVADVVHALQLHQLSFLILAATVVALRGAVAVEAAALLAVAVESKLVLLGIRPVFIVIHFSKLLPDVQISSDWFGDPWKDSMHWQTKHQGLNRHQNRSQTPDQSKHENYNIRARTRSDSSLVKVNH